MKSSYSSFIVLIILALPIIISSWIVNKKFSVKSNGSRKIIEFGFDSTGHYNMTISLAKVSCLSPKVSNSLIIVLYIPKIILLISLNLAQQ